VVSNQKDLFRVNLGRESMSGVLSEGQKGYIAFLGLSESQQQNE
jgi:hypothetical protein